MGMWRVCFLLVLVMSACTKYDVQEDLGNNPGPDHTITEESKIGYINRLYITLLGKKPDTAQSNKALAQLNVNPNNFGIRKSLVLDITQDSVYVLKLWEDARGEVLDGVDTAYIKNEYDYAVDNFNNTTGNSKLYWQEQMQLLGALLTIPAELEAETISVKEMYKRAVHNSIYDEINMGTENFVVSVFQNFFYRYPTLNELDEGKKMVNGSQAVLFLQTGKSKQDFIDIVFNSTAFYEGQIMRLHQKYLFRQPTSTELSTQTQAFEQHGDFKDLQTDLLASDEYFFF